MNNKLIGIILCIILGASLGFGLSYGILQPKIESLQTSITELQNNLVNNLDTRSWHKIYLHHAEAGASSNNFNSTSFEIKGKSVRIRWGMSADFSNDWIDVWLFYQNGTTCSARGSSGVFGSYACDVEIVEPGMYFVEIRTSRSVQEYLVCIWDYY